jgi:hypothetical protein
MTYFVSDEVPEAWNHIISTFLTLVTHDVEFNKGIPVDNLQFKVKRGALAVTYTGGNKITDAFAFFAKEMSSRICMDCGLPSTKSVFESPKCDNCY